ncbi:sugar transferase [Vibrio fluvialis]|uniref:sugar transferase n=2 Tax=Vibrio fluvialis TaxID=676 RepID=UPI000407946D|nr:sugar transferase [Vibrio fluvialis]ELK3676978.1 sugar transferase [Vibrio fluvialis]MBY8242917.1 sugar transferase [Vibrio fluvialis]MCG6390501.1 sugar transferase [Vibrio fluvialis]MCG6418153.1 sugar transferase [Vibrio fluvialis]
MLNNTKGQMGISLAKRTFDFIVASLLLIAVSPLFPLIALAIKLNSRGPVFYTQLRVGHYTQERAQLFYIIKFRTMYQDCEKRSGACWATENDPRITSVGRFMRKTRLDELPQLINVVKGEMSLVGPRPERPCFYDKLESAIPFFAERTYGLLPGITGLAQVSQGYDTCIEDVRRKVGFDHGYALALGSFKTWLTMDLLILSKTVSVMLMGRGQ